ncbi:MAG: patatin-like phospholipase family protein [Caldilineales bacterium]
MSDLAPVVGIALGGGGARGLAHIGVLKVLQREGIFPRLVAGTSMGGVIGAMYAAGLSAEQMEAEAAKATSGRTEMIRVVDVNLSQTGIVRGARIYNYIAEIIGLETRFSDLRRPLSMVAVDLNTGREVVLNTGRVADAVRATISVPGVFKPVEIGPLRLVDGGMLNNVPVDVARKMGADVVIAVDVLPSFTQNVPGKPPVVAPLRPKRVLRAYRDLWHVVIIMTSAATEARLQQWPPDVLLRPDVDSDIDVLLGFNRMADAVAAGEAAAEAALDQIMAAVRRTQAAPANAIDNNSQ